MKFQRSSMLTITSERKLFFPDRNKLKNFVARRFQKWIAKIHFESTNYVDTVLIKSLLG